MSVDRRATTIQARRSLELESAGNYAGRSPPGADGSVLEPATPTAVPSTETLDIRRPSDSEAAGVHS
jgi:hypothetical protein